MALYKQTEDGWFVYREDLSCAMYFDQTTGTTVRISDRRDEGVVYFSAINEGWQHLEEHLGETVTISLCFEGLNVGHGAGGVVIRNPDGRLGYSCGHIVAADFLRDVEQSNGLVLAIWSEWGGTEEIERFDISGGSSAVRELQTCSVKFF